MSSTGDVLHPIHPIRQRHVAFHHALLERKGNLASLYRGDTTGPRVAIQQLLWLGASENRIVGDVFEEIQSHDLSTTRTGE